MTCPANLSGLHVYAERRRWRTVARFHPLNMEPIRDVEGHITAMTWRPGYVMHLIVEKARACRCGFRCEEVEGQRWASARGLLVKAGN